LQNRDRPSIDYFAIGRKEILKEGQKIPFGYGLVGPVYEYYRSVEILPIPLNYIKRFWYELLDRDYKYLRSKEWIKQLQKEREETRQQALDIIKSQNILFTKDELLEFAKRFMEEFENGLQKSPDEQIGWILRFVDIEWKNRKI